jgi:hypothetical protein
MNFKNPSPHELADFLRSSLRVADLFNGHRKEYGSEWVVVFPYYDAHLAAFPTRRDALRYKSEIVAGVKRQDPFFLGKFLTKKGNLRGDIARIGL